MWKRRRALITRVLLPHHYRIGGEESGQVGEQTVLQRAVILPHEQAASVALRKGVACYEFVGKGIVEIVDLYVGNLHLNICPWLIRRQIYLKFTLTGKCFLLYLQ